MLSPFDYAVIVFYFAFTLSLGFVFKKLNVGGTDYFASGRRMNWWLLGASSFVSNFSAWAFTGAAGMAFSFGVIVFSITILDIVGFLVSYFWFAGRFRRLRLVTAMDAVRLRFGPANEQLFTWLQIIAGFFGGAVWMVGLSILLSSAFGFPQVPLILGCTIVISTMALIGGRWAVTGSDFVQTIMLSGISLSVAGLTIYHLGGFGGVLEAVPKENWQFFRPIGSIEYDWVYVTTALLWGIYQKNSILFGAAKYIAAKDDKHAKKSVLIPIIGYMVLALAWFLPPMVAGAIIPDLEQAYARFTNPSEASYIAVCLAILPQGLLGLAIAGFFAATLSSMDTGLNVNAGFLVKNFYQPVFRPQASEQELLKAGYFATLICAIIILTLAVTIVTRGEFSLFDAYLYLNAYLQAPLTVALFLAVFIRKTPSWSGWATVLLGIASTIAIYDIAPLPTPQRWITATFGEGFASYIVTNKFAFTNFFTIPLCTVFFLVTRFFYKVTPSNSEYVKNVNDFSNRLDTPVDFEAEVGKDNTPQQASIMGTLCLVYGAFVSLGIFIPNDTPGRIAIIFCASLLIGTGITLRVYTGKLLSRAHDQ